MPPGAASEAGEAGERSYGPEAGPAAGTAAAELLPLPPGWASCDLESGPPSPSRIPAFRAPDQQQQEQQSHLPSFQLHAWPATMHSEPAFVDGADSYSAASEQEAQQVRPACRRACHALAGLAAAAAGAVGRLVPAASRLASPPLELPIRSRSMEILSMGREPSAPYLPGKQALRRSSAASAMAARRRWRLACRAVIDARRVEECMDLLADRLAPAEDRLHAAVVLAQRLKAYPQRQQGAQPLGCALLARRPRGQLGWGQVLLQELYVTGGWVPAALPCCCVSSTGDAPTTTSNDDCISGCTVLSSRS